MGNDPEAVEMGFCRLRFGASQLVTIATFTYKVLLEIVVSL